MSYRETLTHHTALTLLGSLRHLLQHLLGSLSRSFCLTRHSASVLCVKESFFVMVNTAVIPRTDVSNGSARLQ